jgi:predicted transport protein
VSSKLTDFYETLKTTPVRFGDDVQIKTLKLSIAFERIKDFAMVEVHANQDRLLVFVKVDPNSITLEDGFNFLIAS